MKKTAVRSIAIVILILVVIAVWLFQSQAQKKGLTQKQGQEKMMAVMMVPQVEVTLPKIENLTTKAESVGTLLAQQSVDVTSEITGTIKGIYFKSGSAVKKGQVLVQLDSSTQQAQLDSAKAQEAVALANYQRQIQLVQDNFVSKQAVDQALTTLKVAKATTMQSQVMLNKTTIKAPFDAVAGLKNIDLGQYVQPGVSLVNLQDTKNYHVDFSLPQRLESKVKVGQAVQLSFDGAPGKTFTASISAISPLVGNVDRALSIRADLHETKNSTELRAGMFGKVVVGLGEEKNATLLPTQAIVVISGGSNVYVIKTEGNKTTAVPVAVTTGEVTQGMTQITSQLDSHALVVVNGQERLGEDATQVRVIKTVTAEEAAK